MTSNLAQKLQELKQLLDNGLLTPAEFERERETLLAAWRASSAPSVPAVSVDLDALPTVIALPLREYLDEVNPVLKLWYACDGVEMLLRLVVMMGLAVLSQRGPLTPELRKRLREYRLEEPTLGNWRALAEAVVEALGDGPGPLPELPGLVRATLAPLLRGPGEGERDESNSFIRLRNRLAHGGGISRALAQRLGEIWQPRLLALWEQLAGRRVVFLLDGLDEIAARDARFAQDAPLALTGSGILWICAGRPEYDLPAAFAAAGAVQPFPDGLPGMSEGDIRNLLLERIGPLRKHLLRHDQEQGERIGNPFVEKVAKAAAGVPLYVKYVIDDIFAGRYVSGALELRDGRILSWLRRSTLRLWDGQTVTVLFAPDGLAAQQEVTNSQLVSGCFVGWDNDRMCGIVAQTGLSSAIPVWHGDSATRARVLLPDGTLVVTLDSGHVFFLKLHHSARRISLAEWDELLAKTDRALCETQSNATPAS
ncbi:MAG: SHOCT domain-containing protein [Candidatus Contendobacter sp.]|nr:SHOCT domain-containing protein [Candidatus Contendobacter sp.]